MTVTGGDPASPARTDGPPAATWVGRAGEEVTRPDGGVHGTPGRKFTGCTSRQLRYWDQIGLVQPSVQSTGGRPGVPRLYSFRDLVALRVVKSLLDGGMSLQRVRRSWEFLNKKADLDQHLSEVQLVTDGQSIFKVYRRDGEVMDALKEGQMAFFVAIDDIATSVRSNVRSFEEDRERFVRALREAAAHTATGT